MEAHMKNKLLFLLFWNILLLNNVHGRVTNYPNNTDNSNDVTIPVSDSKIQPIPVTKTNGNGSDVSNIFQDIGIPVNVVDNNEATESNPSQAASTLQDSKNSNVVNLNKAQDASQNLGGNDSLNMIANMIGKLLGSSMNSLNSPFTSNSDAQSDDSLGITVVPVTQTDSSQSTVPTENAISPTQQKTPTQDTPDSIGITIVPITQDDPSQNNNSAKSTALVPYQQEVTPKSNSAEGEQNPVQSSGLVQQNPDETNSAIDSSALNQGCEAAQNHSADSQPEVQFEQVSASQILYHLKVQYERLHSKQSDSDSSVTYEITQTQKTFLKQMLNVSENMTSQNNKNIVSTTYAAYYSTEYAYTFALCKLHHLNSTTQQNENQQSQAHADVTSKCSQILETFSSFNMSYKEVISEVLTATNGNDVLKYDSDGDKSSTGSSNGNNFDKNPANKKISTSQDEMIQKDNLEKDLRGYDANNFYNRVKSEGHNLDKFDSKQSQQIGNSTYSNETNGKKSESAQYLLSEVREIPKDKSPNDPSNEALRSRKMSNTLRLNSEADTRGHVENDDVETDSNRLQKYQRTQKQLDKFERNNFSDDNKNVGGNIENAILQDVDTHYSSTVEHIQDINEQVTKPINHETKAKKYTFKQAVDELVKYIDVLHVFIGNIQNNSVEKENANNEQAKDIYKKIHENMYEKTFIHRQYLREYFASTKVENGTFSGTDSVQTLETETETFQTTIEERFSWLENIANLQSDTDDTKNLDGISSNPIKLLWYFEENNFYLERYKLTRTTVPFMSYLPYPNFEVKTNSNNPNGVDVQFSLN